VRLGADVSVHPRNVIVESSVGTMPRRQCYATALTGPGSATLWLRPQRRPLVKRLVSSARAEEMAWPRSILA
jgi:hypothetical protein